MKFLQILFTIALLGACSHHSHKHHSEIVKIHKDWGNLKEVRSYHDHVYISAQPNAEAIKSFKDSGGEIVINLRNKKERGFLKDEKSIVESNGMKYFNLPVNGKDMSKTQFNKIEDIIASNPKQKVLLHCSSGNRAASWFAYHAWKKHKDSPEKALEVGRSMGLTKKNLEPQIIKMMK
ncbi:MAG: sulfur transferase domain-containing protein [Bdellovibrionales bacterium]